MDLSFLLIFTSAFISVQSKLKESDIFNNELFSLVTDFGLEDCDTSSEIYNPQKYHNRIPGCISNNVKRTCQEGKCFPGYKCADISCVLDEESCMKYYANPTFEKNAYFSAQWKAECLPDGSWKAKQCKGFKRCYCYDHKGNRIFGDAFYEDAEDMTCECSRRRAELENTSGQFFVSLHCDSKGNYEPLQCDSDQCWCVEPKTGDLTSPVVPEVLMTQLPCYNATLVGKQYLRRCESHLYAQEKIRDEFAAHGQNVSFAKLKCSYDGSYGPYKLDGDIYYCVWKDNTVLGSYQGQTTEDKKTMNCNCARDKKIYELAGMQHLLACLSNGNYNPVQQFEDEDGNDVYYCVDSDGFRKSPLMPVPAEDMNVECKKYLQ